MKNSKGLTFTFDAQGVATQVCIDLTIHGALFSMFYQAYLLQKGEDPDQMAADSQVAEKEGEQLLTPEQIHKQKIEKLLTYARSFIGTKYLSGGTTEAGMDCSGFVFTTFKHIDLTLSRTSRGQAIQGQRTAIEDLLPGDLVFFATGADPERISHVGIISKAGQTPADLWFIHASSSRGVTEEALFRLDYYKKAFRHAQRVIDKV